MFSQSTLDRIHDRSILEVADRLLIRYRGTTGNFRRCSCFMHDDRHPSMWFKLSTNTWHCAVCGKGGDSIRLVMEHENLKFDEAVRWIIREFGIFCLDDDDWSQRQWQTRNRKSYSQTISTPIRTPFRMSNPSSSSPTPSHLPTTTPSHLQVLTDQCLSTDSTFCRALLSNGILSEAQMHNAARNYRLGATRDGGVFFWMIDTDERVREGKVMYYQTDCHRDHNRSPTTISSILKKQGKLTEDFRAAYCLFGLHLLRDDTAPDDDTVVAVVESEKTALICSELIPAIQSKQHPDRQSPVIWLASGGLTSLNVEKLAPLVGRRIIIFPDTDPDGKAFAQWSTIAKEASRALGQPFPVSDILERQASPEQKQRKIDIADLLLERQDIQSINTFSK